MVALAALIWLPRWAIAGVALIMLAGTISSMASELKSSAEPLGLGTSCMSPVWCLSAMG